MVDVSRFNEWRVIMKEQEVVDIFRNNQMLSWTPEQFKMNFEEYALDELFSQSLLSKKKELKRSFFDIKNIMQHVKLANVAFQSISRNPRGMLYSKSTYFMHLVEEQQNVVRLMHLWRSIYDYMIEMPKPSGGAYPILMETIRGYTTLILDNPTPGTLIMFTRQNVPLWKDAQFQYPVVWKIGDPLPGRNIHINLSELHEKRPRLIEAQCETCLNNQSVGFACGWCKVALYCNHACRLADEHHEQVCGLI